MRSLHLLRANSQRLHRLAEFRQEHGNLLLAKVTSIEGKDGITVCHGIQVVHTHGKLLLADIGILQDVLHDAVQRNTLNTTVCEDNLVRYSPIEIFQASIDKIGEHFLHIAFFEEFLHLIFCNDTIVRILAIIANFRNFKFVIQLIYN